MMLDVDAGMRERCILETCGQIANSTNEQTIHHCTSMLNDRGKNVENVGKVSVPSVG